MGVKMQFKLSYLKEGKISVNIEENLCKNNTLFMLIKVFNNNNKMSNLTMILILIIIILMLMPLLFKNW